MADRRTITRADLTEAAAYQTGADMRDAKELVDAVFEAIADELVDGSGTVLISGFGNFTVRRTPPRLAPNPKRPDELHPVRNRNRVVFRARGLRERMNGDG